jgi:hypothetical protein
MIEFEAKCFNAIFPTALERIKCTYAVLFQYLSASSFRVAIDDSHNAQILEGE